MRLKLALPALIALLCFAANSLLCRAALLQTDLDPTSFTLLRLGSGAIMLLLLCAHQWRKIWHAGSTAGGFSLLLYAVCFAFAYRGLDTGVGALVLFACVQLSLLAIARFYGEVLSKRKSFGFALGLMGLALFFLPADSPPQPIPRLLDQQPISQTAIDVVLMMAAGIAWAVYTRIGKSMRNPELATCSHFLRAALLASPLLVIFHRELQWHSFGALLAISSGALSSALGYVVWYRVLPLISTNTAAAVQLTVPILAAGSGALLLGEVFTETKIAAALLVLLGLALALWKKRSNPDHEALL
jgi:drug/metabolite transporter (DMT)-like permease